MNDKDRIKKMGDALHGVSGFLKGMFAHVPYVPAETLALLTEVQAACGCSYSSSLPHDNGAIARCSYCQRYTANPAALHGYASGRKVVCDCGRDDGWSGSFKAPDDDARWSLEIQATMNMGK